MLLLVPTSSPFLSNPTKHLKTSLALFQFEMSKTENKSFESKNRNSIRSKFFQRTEKFHNSSLRHFIQIAYLKI